MENVVENRLQEIEAEAIEAIETVADPRELEMVATRFLGRKGVLTSYLRNISSLDPSLRPAAGKNANVLKIKLESALKVAYEKLLSSGEAGADVIDVTLPGRMPVRGFLHPITKVASEICDIFLKLGFDIAEGPEV